MAQDLDVDVTWILLLPVEFGGDLPEEMWRGHCDLEGPTGLTRYTIYVGRRGGTWLVGARNPSNPDRIVWRAEPHPTKEAAMAAAHTALLARLAQRVLEHTFHEY